MVTSHSKRKRVSRERGNGDKELPPPKILKILKMVKVHLEDAYGGGVLKVILYGSHARGDAHEGSDVDVAIIVKDSLDPREVERSLEDVLWRIVVDEGELVAAIAYREIIFEGRGSSHIQNIKAEGITI
jgi:predicted nucleotidyltransferase